MLASRQPAVLRWGGGGLQNRQNNGGPHNLGGGEHHSWDQSAWKCGGGSWGALDTRGNDAGKKWLRKGGLASQTQVDMGVREGGFLQI